MTSLFKILLEREFERKESIKKTYHTYSCYFIVKFKKKINRVQAVERVRGIKTVTIVDLRGDEKLEKINKTLVDYEYSSVEVKFVTNKNPKDQVEFIKKAMVTSDKDKGIDNIIGIVAASPRLETLKQID
jgi:hypothetical protein